MDNNSRRRLGVALYALGILLIIALAATAVVGDMEASLFDAAIRPEETLRSMRCPVLITRDQVGRVSARFENTGQRPVARAIRVHISQGFVTLFREEDVKLPLQPGERQRLAWEVTADDAAFGSSLILTRISTLRQAPMPSQSNACGIFVVDLPWIGGTLATAAWLTLGLLGIGAGGWLWLRASRPLTARRRSAGNAMLAVAITTLAALAAGLAGFWVFGVALLAILVLLLIALASQAILDS